MRKKKRLFSVKLQGSNVKRKLEVRERRGYAQISISRFLARSCKMKKKMEEDSFLSSLLKNSFRKFLKREGDEGERYDLVKWVCGSHLSLKLETVKTPIHGPRMKLTKKTKMFLEKSSF